MLLQNRLPTSLSGSLCGHACPTLSQDGVANREKCQLFQATGPLLWQWRNGGGGILRGRGGKFGGGGGGRRELGMREDSVCQGAFKWLQTDAKEDSLPVLGAARPQKQEVPETHHLSGTRKSRTFKSVGASSGPHRCSTLAFP